MKADATFALPDVLAPLIAERRWVCWRWQQTKKGKKTKVPYRPARPQIKASTKNPKTWSDYNTAVAAYGRKEADGIGFCLLGSGIGAFDVDDCRNPKTGELDGWAKNLVARAASYTEVTVSGTGLRIIGRVTKADKIHTKQSVANGVSLETYRNAERFLVMTGNVLPDAPLVLAELDSIMETVVAELKASKPKSTTKTKSAKAATDTQDELDDIIVNGCGDRFGGDRSRAVWFVVNEMLRRGYRPAHIVATLLKKENGISDHIYEQKTPDKYAERQVAKAVKDIDFTRNEDGNPHASPDNIRIALLKLGVTLRFDEFADRTLIDGLADFGPALNDAAVDRLWLLMGQRFKLFASKGVMRTVVQDAARLNRFHPVRDFLDGLRWDGKPRIDRWLSTYGGAEDSPYVRAVAALMLVAAVRRVRQPGAKFDEMVVLENEEQGTNKSSALSTLAVREDWFSDDIPLNVEGRRVIEALQGRWIVEAAELSGLKRADVEHLKAFLSRTVDRARLAYGHLPIEVPRQCVIVGTTNAREYLKDTSGNRRFWPVLCKAFDIDALRRDRDQLWAEAVRREAEGASIRLPRGLWPAAAVEQRQRLTIDPYVDALRAALGDMVGKISSESVWEILDAKVAQRTQDQSRRVTDAMRALGWVRANSAGTVKIAKKMVAGYVAGDKPWRTIVAKRKFNPAEGRFVLEVTQEVPDGGEEPF